MYLLLVIIDCGVTNICTPAQQTIFLQMFTAHPQILVAIP